MRALPVSPRVVLAALLLVGLTLVAGCDGDDEEAAPGDDDRGAEGVAAVAGEGLECETAGYPCVWDEVPGETVAASAQLGAELSEYAADWDPDALAELISDHDDVVDAAIGHLALWFRLDSGRPVWVLADAAYFPEGDSRAVTDRGAGLRAVGASAAPSGHAASASSATAASSTASASSASAPASARRDPRLGAVVGDDPAAKSALVLSPYAFEHAMMSDAHVVDILEAARGYAGNVTHLSNDDEAERNVGPDAFAGWDAYDVIHVATHGAQVCASRGCLTALTFNGESREIDQHEFGPALMEELGYADAEGVGLMFAQGEAIPFVHGEWLAATYAGALDDTIVFINACSSAQTGDLSTAFAGDGSLFLGWSDVVMSDHAWDAAERYYTEMSERGIASGEAYVELADAGLDRRVLPDDYQPEVEPEPGFAVYEMIDGELQRVDPDEDPPPADTALEHHDAAVDLRLREVIEIQDPASGEMLQGGEEIGLLHGPDGPELPVRFQVDGVLDGEEPEFVVDLRVNGVGAPETWSVADDGELVDEGTYVITDSVPLTDAMAEAPQLDLEATTTLPEGGESEHHVTIEPIDLEVAVEITMDFTELPGATIASTVTASAPLGADDEEELRGSGVLEWERFEYSIPEGSCTVATADFATELEIVGGWVDLDAGDAEVAWRFDEGQDTLDLTCEGVSTSAFMDAFMGMAPGGQTWDRGSADMMAFGFSIAPAYVALGMGEGDGISYIVDGERLSHAEAEDATGGGADPDAIVLTDWQPGSGEAYLEFSREGTPPGMATSFTMQLRPREQ